MMDEPDVTIVDCGPRDGLAAVPGAVSTSDKLLLIKHLSETGLRKIDSVAFTHPRVVPKDSDAEKVMEILEKKPHVTYIGLAPSEIGCRRAANSEIDEILTLVAASESFSRAALGLDMRENLNKVLPGLFEIVKRAEKTIRTFVLTAFGCPYSGMVRPRKVVDLVSRLDFMGVDEVSLVDNTGIANPRQVKELLQRLLDSNLNVRLGVHFHDTRGMAMANTIAAYEAGIRIFDTAIGGLSGPPFGAPRMEMGRWNVATEDLVHVFEEMGIRTGMDLDRLLSCVELAEKIAGRTLPGHILRAGPASRLMEIPTHLEVR